MPAHFTLENSLSFEFGGFWKGEWETMRVESSANYKVGKCCAKITNLQLSLSVELLVKLRIKIKITQLFCFAFDWKGSWKQRCPLARKLKKYRIIKNCSLLKLCRWSWDFMKRNHRNWTQQKTSFHCKCLFCYYKNLLKSSFLVDISILVILLFSQEKRKFSEKKF